MASHPFGPHVKESQFLVQMSFGRDLLSMKEKVYFFSSFWGDMFVSR